MGNDEEEVTGGRVMRLRDGGRRRSGSTGRCGRGKRN